MISLVLILLVSFLFGGIIIRTRSLLSGRKGPGILQPMKDLWRLLRKNSVYSSTTSFIFRIAPTVYLASVICAVLFIPFGRHPALLSFAGDFIFFTYVMALGKFFMIASAMDTGSSFPGMGASREALFSLLAEPAFLVLLGSFALYTGHTSFHSIFQELHFTSFYYTFAVLAVCVLVVFAMVENSRIPVDDPRTHLELTMIHEVMVLDHSGFDLGLIAYSSHLKFALYGAIIANIFLDASMSLFSSILLFAAAQVVFAGAVGIIESFIARIRMSHNSQFIFSLISISLLIFLGVLLTLENQSPN